MKAKDTNRLSVVRGILNEVANASKTSSPVKTDMQLLAMLRKRAASAQSASDEFKNAGRQDLQEKEDSQMAILHEYASGIKTMSENDVHVIVSRVIGEMKDGNPQVAIGDVLKRVLGPGGVLDGKPVDKSVVARLSKDLLLGSR